MKYILLMHNSENAFNEEELTHAREQTIAICHELHVQGKYVTASPLKPMAETRSVRVREGARTIIDGPYAETKEQLGGHIIVDVETKDEALEIAAQLPAAQKGTIQVRPMVDLPSLPRHDRQRDLPLSGSRGGT